MRLSSRMTSRTCSAISGGREKVMVLDFLGADNLLCLRALHYLTICHGAAGLSSSRSRSWGAGILLS